MANHFRTRRARAVVLGSLLLSLVACGGGGSDGESAKPTIRGTAAAGAPIIGTVTIKDSSTPAITRMAPIRVDGSYTLDVSGLTPPFMLRADGTVGGRGYSLYSAAVETDVNGTINITPLTNLIIANVALDLAETVFESGDFSALTAEQIAAETEELRAKLEPVLVAVGLETSIDLLRMSFATDHSGLDAVLDVVNVEIDVDTKVATVRNIVNGDSFTSDVATGTLAGDALDPGDAVTTISTLQSISTRLADFAALYAAGMPTEQQIKDVNLFDWADFLDDGMDWDIFVTGLLTDMPTGFRISNASILGVELDTMNVSFDIILDGQVVDTETTLVRKDAGTGLYLYAGNRQIVAVEIASHHIYYPWEGGQYWSGLFVEIEDPRNTFEGRGKALVRGPGAIDHWFYQDIQSPFGLFTQAPGLGGMAIWLTDLEIAQIPDTNAVYTFDVYYDGSAEPTVSYDVVLKRRPVLHADLAPSLFIVPGTVSPSNLTGFTGGTITATFTMPAGLGDGWFAASFNDGTRWNWLDTEVDHATWASVVVPASTFDGWGATRHGGVYVGAYDVYDREFQTGLARF